MTVGVSFVPGSGGHLVGSIIANMLFPLSPIQILDDGSVNRVWRNMKSGAIADTGIVNPVDSFSNELTMLNSVETNPLDDIQLMHVRNLCRCVELWEKFVYVSFTSDDIPLITRRLTTKMNLDAHYDAHKGDSWPLHSEVAGNLPDWIVQEMRQNIGNMLHKWYWVMPVSLNLFEIKFSDLTTGSYLDDLAEFLGVRSYNGSYIRAKLAEYYQKQPDAHKYVHGNTE